MPQIIPLVITAITTVTSAVVAAGPLAVAAFNAANVIGAGLLANEAFKAVQPQVKSSGAAIEWNADPNAPNRFAFGRIGGAGNIIHNAVYGPDDMFVGFVGVMSASGPIKAWVGFKAEDRHVSFNGSGEAVTSPYNDKKMWLDRLRGEQPETRALASPAGLKNGAQMPRWGASYRLSGKAAYMYTLSENSKRSAYKGKVPTGIHTIEGLFHYDPRRDSTYPGGSGPCRLNDPLTWVYSTNAYIHALSWAIGRWEGLTAGAAGAPYASQKVGGIGARPDGVDFSSYIEAANAFDERAWACSAWPDADEGKGAVLDSFLQAGGGLYAESKGRISCLHRIAPRASIVTITADDTAGTIEYDTTTSLLERLNTLRPQYWSEANGWQMVATDEVTHQDWREEDGQGVAVTKSKGLDYNYVPGSKQVRELAALQISHTREGIRGTVPLRNYLDLEEGDCFTFEVPEAVLNGQKCIVLNVDPDLENGIIHVTFSSETDAKYPFAYGQADRPPPAPSITPSDPTVVNGPLPGEWNIVPRPPEQGGVQQPGLDLTGIISNARAERVLVEHALDPAGPWTQAYDGPPTTERIEINGLQSGATYYVAITYFNAFGNPSPRTIYGPYTAGDLIAGDTTHLAGEPVQDVLDKLTDTATLAGETVAEVQSIRDMYGDTADATTSALKAAAHEAAANQAKADAIIAAVAADGRAADANQARADALIAKGDAQASASTAAQKATDAAGSAAAALTSKNDAVASATTATTKALDAAGSAATAVTQAGLAAGSATAAGGSATAAAGSASTANTKANEAGNSANAANASRVVAESARDTAGEKATAAAQSAASAATSSTQAGQSASAAQTAKTAAETARAGAEAAQTSATNSATTATGAAATATTQAGIATTAKNDAQAASSAAVTAKNQASSFADAAGVGSAASVDASLMAQAARDGALAAAIDGIPATVDQTIWSSVDGNGGAPLSLPDASSAWQIINDPDLGRCWSATGAGGAGGINLTPKGVLPRLPGRKYEISFRGRIATLAPDGTTNIQVLISRMDGAYASVAGRLNLNDISHSETGLFDYTRIVDCDLAAYSSAAFIRPSISVNRADGAPIDTRIGAVTIEDVTAREASKSSASAAASSASSAAASDAAAGQSASAAQTAKTAAETARAGAEAAQTSATNSATTATGAAATATTQAGIATTAKNDAQAASSAAVTARNQASSFADAAGVGSAASVDASLTAQAARDGAVGAAILSMPDAIRPDLWSAWGSAGRPEDRLNISASTVDGGAYVGSGTAGPKQYLMWETGKIIELVSTVHNPHAIDTLFRHSATRRDAGYGLIGALSSLGPSSTTIPAGQTATVTTRFGMDASAAGIVNLARDGAEWIAVQVRNALTGDGSLQNRVLSLTVRDVTASINAEASASAASTSASNAAASETVAGQSASAATTAKTQAETARGQAQTAATQASSSRDDAAGSAATAVTQAGLAAGSATAAGGSATAAAGSASTANTKATEAVNSASAAQASQVAATAAQAAAETARGQAQSSASAASTSASNAAASATTAGEKATAASGSASTAATRAGEALTSRNQAASSASDAAGSALTAIAASGTAVTARNDAQAAAATAVTQSSSATDAAAEARLSANLAAQTGGGSMNPNPAFAAWSGSETTGPDNWFAVNPANGALSKGPGANGQPQSLRTASSSTANYSANSSTFSGAEGGEWLALTVEFTLVSGDLRGSGVQVHKRQDGSQIGSSLNLNFATEPDAAGNVAGSGVVGRRYSYTKLLDGRQAGANGYSVFARTRLSTFSPIGAATIDWHRLSVRVATAEEVATRTVLPAVEAQASLAMSASADALTQLGRAAFELIIASGGLPAYIKGLAGPGGNEIALAATKLLLLNVIGDQAVTALELINGEAYFGAPVSVDIDGRRLTIGPGFGATDSKVVLWFGANTVALASMSRANGYFALGTDGKVYYGSAELGSGGSGAGGAAFQRASVAGTISGSSYVTLASVTFNGRPATGWWDANLTGLGGASDGFSDNDIEFRVIEQGGAAALASGVVTVPAGVPGLLSLDLSPSAPWPQTRPAGNLTLQLQVRRIGGSGTTTISNGAFGVNYTPGV